ncbi:DNA polymerase/3'-5' exonuclease PolX [Sphingobacterium hotanense]|uniref:DNA polymerase/3'-5' exonuclease PolX n=1 Tax=Sphingobacterium hotanense TaxID=649196 RepID=UPI0021A4C279|nr:DNA polymerase/3'-5' exonuclease PolX [Sphingobacterium hotanense]MCT1524405.1 helix-hairpin-helix domain-containing protein [Sphingobacterium hotanense]
MTNKDIAKVFKLCGQLMELHNENPFRTKAMAGAAFRIDKLPFAASGSNLEELSEQPNIGKSTAEKIMQVITTGTFPDLEKLLDKTPEGIVEMLKIKGLGPKKIQIIWNDLAIESVGELYYACNENRLVEAKGFGLKTQEDIKKAIEFSIANQGWYLFAKVLNSAHTILASLKASLKDYQVEFTGDFRRKAEVLQHVELITDAPSDVATEAIKALDNEFAVDTEHSILNFRDENNTPFKVYLSKTDDFAKNLLLTTGSALHIELLKGFGEIPSLDSEDAIYTALGSAYIEPELREGTNEIELAKNNALPRLITYADLKGSLHNHSTYSDGVHSLKEMAQYLRDELKMEYLGICDHSKTAVYANGLSIERLEQQWAEIDRLNAELAPFKIFKGIESDILSDGSLDYPDDVLAKIDFVVASIHSNLKMDEEKATTRLIKAIENPYTTMLGHPTGRLLLSRAGYPIDFRKVIDACAANNVVIEINANPLRLDLDWRWHQYALEKGVLLSVNPDAHRKEGFLDMEFGIYVARKGGLSVEKCLNAFTLEEITTYFNNRKSKA